MFVIKYVAFAYMQKKYVVLFKCNFLKAKYSEILVVC